MNTYMTSNRVAFIRRQAGLTQTELANKVEMPPQWISKIERGAVNIRNISFINALKLADALKVDAHELMR